MSQAGESEFGAVPAGLSRCIQGWTARNRDRPVALDEGSSRLCVQALKPVCLWRGQEAYPITACATVA